MNEAEIRIQRAQDDNVGEIDLAQLGLTELPESLRAMPGLSSLVLWGNQLSELPPWLGDFRNLQSLNVAANRLSTLPESFQRLTSLNHLDISNNNSPLLPSWLGQLPFQELNLAGSNLAEAPDWLRGCAELRFLDVSVNHLTSLPQWISKFESLETLIAWDNPLRGPLAGIGELRRLTKLNLAHTSAHVLSEEIQELEQLRHLDVSNNQLRQIPAWIRELRQLDEIVLWGNELPCLPDWIGELQELKALNIDNNHLAELPDSITDLGNLQLFRASDNRLRRLPQLGCLTQLRSIRAHQNQLEVLPDGLDGCRQVEELIVWGNQLKSIPEAVGGMVELVVLDVSNNLLESLPAAIGNLSKLETLVVWGNQLRKLPDSLGQLSSLKYLCVYRNRLSALPSTVSVLGNLLHLEAYHNQLKELPDLSNLGELQCLNVSDNVLRKLPDSIGQLSNLELLAAHDNQLQEIPASVSRLGKLRTANLADNRLRQLPTPLRKLPALRELFLHGNEPLGIPYELLGPTWQEVFQANRKPADPATILSYYFSLKSGHRPLNEAKLILVGRGGVGKTSLVKRLVHDQFDPLEPQTDGIRIEEWSSVLSSQDTVRMHIWDFGGQEIMHATHQFFLTRRSIYLLVLCGREGTEDSDAEYWLTLIESFAADSRVIVVMNKSHQWPVELNRRELIAKYPGVRAFVATDCAIERDDGIEELRKILNHEIEELGAHRIQFPEHWFSIKERLSGMRENFLSLEEYRSICAANQESSPAEQDALLGYLHQLGIALNFRDDLRLCDTTVLNPHWVTRGIYRILNARRLRDQQGVLRLEDVSAILAAADYPQEKHRYLLDLMEKFELCFRFSDGDRYLIPELLSKEQPEQVNQFDPNECLGFQYHYESVLPEGILPRFIVRSHTLSTDTPRWRTGVILAWEGNHALVKADLLDRRIIILVSGPEHSRRALLAVIRSDFNHIHRTIRKLEPVEKVPVPGHPKTLIPYRELLVYEKADKETRTAVIGDQIVQCSVRELLDGVDFSKSTRRKRESNADQPVRLYFSYADPDEPYCARLEVHLKLLEREGVISQWSKRKIPAGEDIQVAVDRRLAEADIVVLLLSADFFASPHCYDREMRPAMDRHEAGNATVIPVLVRDTSLAWSSLSKLQVLPRNRKPIQQWGVNEDSAWRQVVDAINQGALRIRQSRS